jgi:predicted kinase
MKNDIRNILVLVGIPASGKSTFSKEFIKENPNYIRINRDDIRKMLKDSYILDFKYEKFITAIEFNAVENALSNGFDVIWDNTHIKLEFINKIINKFSDSANIQFKKFDIDLKTAIERDSKRENPVGENIIKRMYDSYIGLLKEFNFKEITKIDNKFNYNQIKDYNLQDTVIFDIDGTIALKGDRGYFDWNKVDVDHYIEVVGEHIEFHKSKGRTIILLSGREDTARNKTMDWLDFHDIPYHFLFMRNEGDYRKDSIIKKEIYENNIKGIYNVHCVYDDRLQVIDMWYNLGLFCFNVNQGNKIF